MTEGIWLGRGSTVSKLAFGDDGPLIVHKKDEIADGKPAHTSLLKPRETLFKFPVSSINKMQIFYRYFPRFKET
jgi:hypothetical protein